MKDKVTKNTTDYPIGDEPNYIIPSKYSPYRFALGKNSDNPLVAICMNPSAAEEIKCDKTCTRIINISKTLQKNGWMVFNLYPERATNKHNMDSFNQDISDKNIKIIKDYLLKNNIKEVWGAWGKDDGVEALIKGREQLLSMLSNIDVKVYYYGTLTKCGNPRHPTQRQEKWDFSDKKYL